MHHRSRHIITPAAILALATPCVHAQCDHQWAGAGGFSGGGVHAVVTYNNQLIAAGNFSDAGGQPASNIARWDGTSWSPLGAGTNFRIHGLAVHAGQLVACGIFSSAGGQPASSIARWDGHAWSPLGSGLNAAAHALTIFQDDLIAAGSFTSAGGQVVRGIARWNGSAWSPLPDWPNAGTVHMRALAVVNGELVAGGFVTVLPTVNVAVVAKGDGIGPWDGGEVGMSASVWSLTGYNGLIIIGGDFSSPSGTPAANIASWDGQSFSPVGSGLDGSVRALTVYNGELIAAGDFVAAGVTPVSRIARWNGSDWSALGAGLAGGEGNALHASSLSLFAGGSFTVAGGQPALRLARWACPCYANCDGSTVLPILNVDDFTCFIDAFAAAQILPLEEQISHYANCDGSTAAPVLTVDDFTCFINAFAAGCP